MRVHSDVPKTVVFVGKEAGGRFLPLGTGFLVGIKSKGREFCYLVTADHVTEQISGETISVRLNRKDGSAHTIELSKAGKIPHRVRSNDIAVFDVPPIYDDGVFDHKIVELSQAHHASQLALWQPDIGDEVATVGLYTSHYGHTKNVPVVRTGNIAMMPGEPVLHHRGDVTAYLIETRSIAGLSGSPVFLNIPRWQIKDGMFHALTGTGVGMFPIGLTLGYQLVSSTEDQIVVPRHQREGDEVGDEFSLDERNTGFAVVVPIERVIEILEDDVLKK